MDERRVAVVHGHFYQPPRENPWTEEVAREASAAPFHDWNARITDECYAPNAAARIIDGQGRVVSIVDNYRLLSFNVGPTLMSWLERHRPDVHEAIVEADRAAGGALAQAFGHMILPLANERDLRTQIRWGLADFEHRFGRRAQGMWLPETAVNNDVLAALAEEGVVFTVLAPSQADRPVDTQRVHRWEHPDGGDKGVDIVFYDGGLSHTVAFELPTTSSQALVAHLATSAGDAGLVTVAADGETFGHHHGWGDRTLAYALAVEAPRQGLTVTNLNRHLASEVERVPVGVVESAWSCVHGVGRWREDCGCATGAHPGWNQRWRAPLRAALDLVRDHAAEVFERRGKEVLREPWEARDAYVGVVIGATPKERFADEHVVGDPVVAFTLLESQRHAMAMYTSCGWFFADLAGLEAVQVLRYAARVLDHLAELDEDGVRAPFLDALSLASSNLRMEGTGRDVWERHVETARVDADRTVAHVALVQLLEGNVARDHLAAYEVDVVDHTHAERGSVAIATGHVVLTHVRTGRVTAHSYAVVRLGGLEVLGATRPWRDGDDELRARLRLDFTEGAPVTRLLRRVSDEFGPREFGLTSALPDAAEQILESAARALAERFAHAYDRLFADHADTLATLATAEYPLPAELRAPAELSLARRFEFEVAAQAGSPSPAAYREAVGIAAEARAGGFRIDTPRALATIERLVRDACVQAVADPEGEAVDAAVALVQLARDLDLHPGFGRAQDVVYAALVSGGSEGLRELGARLNLAVEHLGQP